MEERSKGCGCSVLSYFSACEEQSSTSSSDTEIVMDAMTIQITDQLLIIRENCDVSRVYKGSWNDLSPQTALFIFSKAVTEMPKEDPRDGKTLWNNNGCICIASDPVAQAFL